MHSSSPVLAAASSQDSSTAKTYLRNAAGHSLQVQATGTYTIQPIIRVTTVFFAGSRLFRRLDEQWLVSGPGHPPAWGRSTTKGQLDLPSGSREIGNSKSLGGGASRNCPFWSPKTKSAITHSVLVVRGSSFGILHLVQASSGGLNLSRITETSKIGEIW